MRVLIVVLALVLALPAAAQQRRAAAVTAHAGSIWGQPTITMSEAFDRAMQARHYTTRMDAVICDVTTTLTCDVEIRGIKLRVTGIVEPEQVREIRVLVNRNSRTADVALVAHALMEIAEPTAPEAERRSAVLRLLGISGARADAVTVGGTEARFVDSFSGAAFVFRPASQVAR